MARKRKLRKHSPAFKAKVALEALREQNTLNQIASKYKLNPTQISKWKTQALKNFAILFDPQNKRDVPENDDTVNALYEQIGRLKVENDFLKKIAEQLH